MVSSPLHSNTLIIGAGLAGLSCAKYLGAPATLLEKDNDVGGAARSFTRGDFTFDITGHWLHLRDPDIKALAHTLLGDELVTVARRASIYSHGRLTPYPFQANTYGLPTEVVAECVLGFFTAREKTLKGEHPAPKSFEDFIRQRMGDGIAKHFMIPYNTKLWTVPPSDMAHAWCERFVPLPTAEEVVLGALKPDGAGHALGYNATFVYPKHGGIGRLSHALRDSLSAEVHTNTEVHLIDWSQKIVRSRDGRAWRYDRLVNTMPLTDLVRCIENGPEAVPETVKDACKLLRATTVTYWDIGLPNPNQPDDAHWIYYPELDLPFYRVGAPSAAMPTVAPKGQRSLYVETAHARGTDCPTRDEDVLASLRKVGLIGEHEEPVLWSRNTVDCGYVIMDHAYGPARATVLDWLSSVGIESLGRYGSWMYDSMEGAILQGKRAAERLVR